MPQSAIDQPDSNHVQSSRIDPNDIVQISNDLFVTMLGMEFDSTSQLANTEWDAPVMASIKIEGDWNAEFQIIASHPLATQITQAMFSLGDEEISEDDISDAMGEVINVIGGNAKGIIDGECQLSLPCIGLFNDQPTPETFSLNLDVAGHRFNVKMFDRELK